MLRAKRIISYTAMFLSIIFLSFYIYGFFQYWMGSGLIQESQSYYQFVLALPLLYFVTYILCKSNFHNIIAPIYIMSLFVFNLMNIIFNLSYGPIIKIENLPLYALSVITLLFGIVQIIKNKSNKIMIVFSIIKIIQSIMIASVIGLILFPFFIVIEIPLLLINIFKNLESKTKMRPTTAST